MNGFKIIHFRLVVWILASLVLGGGMPRAALAITDAEIRTINDETTLTSTLDTATESNAGPGVGQILARMSIALGIVFGLMWLTVWLARRYLPQVRQSGRAGGAGIEILSSRSIGARRNLMLVRAQGRTLLLGVTPHAIQTLSEFEGDPVGWNDAAWQAGLDAPSPRPAPAHSGAERTL